MYVDVDYFCLRALDDIAASCECFAGLSNTNTLELNNGIIGYVLLAEIVYILRYHAVVAVLGIQSFKRFSTH